MPNIDRFNAYTAYILGWLYERFPVAHTIDAAAVVTALEKQRAAVVAKLEKAKANDVSIGSKLFMDLCDTAITRLALAECTVPEIRAISGHSLVTIHDVLKHYLALDDRMAESAQAKLRIWMDKQGIAI